MKIHDTVSDFIEHYKPTIDYLERYYDKFTTDYEEYFKYHCHNVEMKKVAAISKHREKIPELIEMKQKMPTLIREVQEKYEQMYPIQFTKDVHLLVGLYGSNAYTYRQIIPEIAFCLEKLPADELYLSIIIGHEFGHATHHIYSNEQNINWNKVNWLSPYTWLLQEGIATYLSAKVVKAREDEYFAFEEDKPWLEFAKRNKEMIIKRFIEDIDKLNPQAIFREWFSINGGEHFGKSRFGYLIGFCTVVRLIEELGELNVLTLWDKDQFETIIREKLFSMI